jgi:hypothetical protein
MHNLPVADRAPSENHVTAYDEHHFPLYIRLLDASDANASPEEMCRVILGRDHDREGAKSLQSHLSRARWMCDQGYKDLLSSRQ